MLLRIFLPFLLHKHKHLPPFLFSFIVHRHSHCIPFYFINNVFVLFIVLPVFVSWLPEQHLIWSLQFLVLESEKTFQICFFFLLFFLSSFRLWYLISSFYFFAACFVMFNDIGQFLTDSVWQFNLLNIDCLHGPPILFGSSLLFLRLNFKAEIYS